MQTTISKWGNSLGLRLPRHIAEAMQLAEGATVKLELEDGSIRITPTKRRFKLAELLQGDEAHVEFDCGKPMGAEDW